MKNMRKLIPAIAMLLVSAVMMSTASFAWFTSANAASASGMQVKAVADGGLAIAPWANSESKPDGTDFKSSVTPKYVTGATLNSGVYEAKMKPASHTGTAWFEATGAQVDKYAASSDYKASTNYLATKFDIRALSETDTYTLKIDEIKVANLGGTAGEINKALRVAVRVSTTTKTEGGYTEGASQWFYFAPLRTDADSTILKHYAGTGGTDKTVATYGLVDTAKKAADNVGKIATSNDLAGTTVATPIYDTLTDDAVSIEVFIYYEGEDEKCISAYALVGNEFAGIEINFTATKNS